MSGKTGMTETEKALDQIHRKREYNKKYYRQRTKPKKEQEKQLIDQYRERIEQLEKYANDVSDYFKNNDLSKTREEVTNLRSEIKELSDYNVALARENETLREALDSSRGRIYDLMMQRSKHLIPELSVLSLN